RGATGTPVGVRGGGAGMARGAGRGAEPPAHPIPGAADPVRLRRQDHAGGGGLAGAPRRDGQGPAVAGAGDAAQAARGARLDDGRKRAGRLAGGGSGLGGAGRTGSRDRQGDRGMGGGGGDGGRGVLGLGRRPDGRNDEEPADEQDQVHGGGAGGRAGARQRG